MRLDRVLDRTAVAPHWLKIPRVADCVSELILKREKELAYFLAASLCDHAKSRAFADDAKDSAAPDYEWGQRFNGICCKRDSKPEGPAVLAR